MHELITVVPPPVGRPADYVISDLTAALSRRGIPSISTSSRSGRVRRRLRIAARDTGRLVLVPMMGADFDFAFAASRYGLPVVLAWDVWEPDLDFWAQQMRRLGPHSCFVTSSQSAAELRKRLNIPVHHAPEATDPEYYSPGAPLKARTVDVLELGRKHDQWHEAIRNAAATLGIAHRYEKVRGSIVYKTRDDLKHGLAETKVSVCFPSSRTHPERAGGTTTLTHRYLESIASRCLIVGESPPELRQLLGFDPVVAVDWSQPWRQLQDILLDIGRWQGLVDRSFDALAGVASWDVRVAEILSGLAGE